MPKARLVGPWRGSSIIQRDLTHAAVRKPENVGVETIATPLQGYQSLLHVLLLAFAGVAQRQRAEAVACVAPAEKGRRKLGGAPGACSQARASKAAARVEVSAFCVGSRRPLLTPAQSRSLCTFSG